MASFKGPRAALLLLVAAVLPAAFAAPALQHGSIVPGKYIVQVRPELADDEFEGQVRWVSDVHRSSIGRRRHGTRGLQKKFSFRGFRAYSGEFDDATVALIRANETVLIVEPDVVVSPLDALTTQEAAEYNLALLSSSEGFDSRSPVHPYTYDAVAGEGQSVYVVDTGVFVEHEDFEGRAFKAYNARPELPFTDGNGHGTHVAGTVGSKTYGVAKKVSIFAVKVLDDDGAGTKENVLDGYNWVVNNATAEQKLGSSLVSMSLGWPTSAVINDAVEAAFQAGLLTVVSAGNDNRTAASKSPASAPNAVTVGATDFARVRSYYSNFGSFVDVWAPGDDVLSLAPSQGATAVKSGTSMSTPLVAGLVAYLRSVAAGTGKGLEAPAAATQRLKEVALQGVVGDAINGSVNLFAHNGVGSASGNGTANGTSVLRRSYRQLTKINYFS